MWKRERAKERERKRERERERGGYTNVWEDRNIFFRTNLNNPSYIYNVSVKELQFQNIVAFIQVGQPACKIYLLFSECQQNYFEENLVNVQ